MNPAAQSYHRTARTLMSARDLEASALLAAAARLQTAVGETAAPTEFGAALDNNRRLWALFAGSVSNPESHLPDDVRARILALADFVFNHTILIESVQDRAAAASLVEINRELAAGLRGNLPRERQEI